MSLLNGINPLEKTNHKTQLLKMKYLKYLLFLLLAIIAIGVLLSFIGPKNLNVVETTEVNAPDGVIYNLVNNLEEMALWNEWTLSDSTIKTTYNEISDGVGAGSSWTSDMTGAGTQEIIESIKNKKVRSVMKFEGWDGENFADIDINPEGDLSKVSWTFEGAPLPFIMRGFALVTGMKKSIQTNYAKGLGNLKKIAESRAKGHYSGYEIKEILANDKHFVMNRQEVNLANVQQFYATNLGALFGKVQQAGVEMNGMPCGLFFKSPDASGLTDMAAAIPVANPISIDGANSYTIEARPALSLDFYGDYNTTELGHQAIDRYMKDRGYLQDPPVIEEYVTDPSQEKDPNKWLTKITYYFSESK